MDDWSLPCGVKINGRGLLIRRIDGQVVSPWKALHLIRVWKRMEMYPFRITKLGGKQ